MQQLEMIRVLKFCLRVLHQFGLVWVVAVGGHSFLELPPGTSCSGLGSPWSPTTLSTAEVSSLAELQESTEPARESEPGPTDINIKLVIAIAKKYLICLERLKWGFQLQTWSCQCQICWCQELWGSQWWIWIRQVLSSFPSLNPSLDDPNPDGVYTGGDSRRQNCTWHTWTQQS